MPVAPVVSSTPARALAPTEARKRRGEAGTPNDTLQPAAAAAPVRFSRRDGLTLPKSPFVPRNQPVAVPAFVPPIPAPDAPTLTTAPPADFRAVPPAAPIPDAQGLKRLLARGTAFPPEVAAALQTMAGTPIRAGGIAAYFAPLLPHCTWVVTGARLTEPGVGFDLSAIDRTGQIAFAATCNMTRHAKGALELHLSNAHVDPTYRGWGLTAQGEQRTGALLQALSNDPESRITLAAGFMNNPNTGAQQPGIGTFLHARRGYLFADAFNANSPFFRFDDGKRQHGQRAMSAALRDWLLTEPTLTYPGVELTAGNRRTLHSKMMNFRMPYQYAEFDVPNYTAQAPGQDAPMALGKAFLLSDKAPVWCGVRFVNPPSPYADERVRKARADSSARFTAQAERELKSAEARRQHVTQILWTGFNSPHADERATAYKVMGLFGDTSLLGYLRQRRQEETDPAALEKLRRAKTLLHGELMVEGLTRAANDASRPVEVRAGLLERLAAVKAATARG